MVKRLPLGPCCALLFLLVGCARESSTPGAVLESTSINFADFQSQEVRFEAPVGSPVQIMVSGQGIDVRAAVLTDANGPADYADAPNRRMGIETLLVTAPHDAWLTLRIERNDHAAAHGTVRVEAVALAGATDRDRQRLRAAEQAAAGSQSFPDAARGQQSADAFEAAARLQDAAGDPLAAGRAWLLAAGARYLRLSDWAGAADRAARAADRLGDADDPQLAAFARRVRGAALDQHANASNFQGPRAETLKLARGLLTEAADRFDQLGNDYEAGYALNYRGVSYLQSGDRAQARRDFQAALRRFQAAADGPAQALSLQSLALLSHEDGRLADAVREFDQALALIPRDADPSDYAHTLHNSALPRRVLGQFDEAIARYSEAGEILRGLGDRDGEARALHGLGTTLLYAGEPERAAELLRTAVRLRGETGARREQAISMMTLGDIERDEHHLPAALELHRQALKLVDAPHDRAALLLALARDERAVGRPAVAEHLLAELLALPLPETHRSLGLALTELAVLEAGRGEQRLADQHFARAIRIHDANGSEVDHGRTLCLRAETGLLAGNTAAALSDAMAALKLFEAVGTRSLQAESRAAFRASYRDAVEFSIQALIGKADSARRNGRLAEEQDALRTALTTSDRTRARWLAESGAAAGSAVAERLLADRARLYELLAGKRMLRDRLLDSGAPDPERLAHFSRDIELLRARAALVDGQIAGSGKPLAPVADAAGADVAATMAPGTTATEFFIGRRNSWRFTVRDGQVRVQRLAAPAHIAQMARELHRSWRQATRQPGDRLADSRRLARLLFASQDRAPTTGLRIVPDGALHLVPMAYLARLVWPELAPGTAVVMPVLSAAGDVSTAHLPPPDRLLAVVADPVYDADDTRIHRRGRDAPPVAVTALTRGARDLRSMRRLPATAIEARELVSLVGDPAQTLELSGPEASRERVVAAPLARYHIVHFATHALADCEDPALATLVLSRWDADGRPVDGALRVYDIARLRLNADLVVLSGCDTALGREIAGEGPIGLSHAFLRSGARAVVATLWQVPDTSTAVLMHEFYRQMLANGKEASVALQLAQDLLLSQPRWADPYYWAGFQLVENAPPAGYHHNVTGRRES